MNRFLLAFSLGVSALGISLLPASAQAQGRAVYIYTSDARLVEPPSGQRSMLFTVNITSVWPSDVDVYYSTSNTTDVPANQRAVDGLDYTAVDNVVTIPAGARSAQIAVPILADNAVENDEAFQLSLDDYSYSEDPDNPDSSISFGRAQVKGIIVEPTKGVQFAGQVINYVNSPFRIYDPSTQTYVDKFDTRAVATPLSGRTLVISNPTFAVTVTTDSNGKYTTQLRPGTYSVRLQPFTRTDDNGNAQTYSLPARTVTISTNTNTNNFYFYGVAGTAGIPSSASSAASAPLSGAYVKIEARPVGASATSRPIATALAQYQDLARVSRGYRFFLPGLPEGKYVLTVKDVDPNNNYTFYYSFPSITVTLPETVASPRPNARAEFRGKSKGNTGSPSTAGSNSGSDS